MSAWILQHVHVFLYFNSFEDTSRNNVYMFYYVFIIFFLHCGFCSALHIVKIYQPLVIIIVKDNLTNTPEWLRTQKYVLTLNETILINMYVTTGCRSVFLFSLNKL